ncbi:hypothetical protein [Salsipaludibacter albus]|uniref:hypothetical protein n=1 Tax=Salsipaludibacter albus TaxID=2849650 RepID=UPI001EE491A3|nr:hypothetical protein [Salsipaludibacter albus]MBY5161793.1 hypothetical protein [Salsipaludibacter albus]
MVHRSDLVALPVVVDGPRHLVDQVGAWIESRLGWQVTRGEALPARLRLVGVGGSSADASVDGVPLPSVALVGPDDDPIAATRLAQQVDAVVAWPAEHGTLAEVVADLVAGDPRVEVESTRVVGSAGGVGVTTIALALGALSAWRERPSLVVGRGDVPVPDVRQVPPEVLAGHRAWAASTGVPGVDGLRAVRVDAAVGRIAPPSGVRVVVDGGVVGPGALPGDAPGDVLVVRRDRPGLAAIEESGAAAVVLVDTGPRSATEVVRAAGGRLVVVVPWSARVARLHDACRLPGSLPGTVLAPLRRLDEQLDA